MTLPITNAESNLQTLMRSGTAARLAGLSPSTLRIWEHRYSVVAPPKSASGQRTYSMKDIERLRLIKRLTAEGHAIGTVAHLETDALFTLSAGSQVPLLGVLRVLVVGLAAARKLEGRLRPAPVRVFDDLEHAERELSRVGEADVLVIHVPSLHASITERVTALIKNISVRHAILVYSFGAEAMAESLRSAGIEVRREPVSGRELAGLICALRPAVAVPVPGVIAEAHRRHYSDTELAALSEMPSMVACECPRHLAEIVTLLVGFEQYSTECVAASPSDAALHRHLYEVTSLARTMMEQALARVVLEEGLVLPA